MVPEVGKKYGPYEILGNLGGGGMGFVYRAWDARLHREVAIKLLHGEFSMPGMRERFLREARAASALNHPNICTIFDIGEQNGEPYLVMELLQGQTLKDLIDARTVQLEELLAMAREVAEALGAAHAKGIIHRDIKPANIFLVDKPNGGVQAKVLDFGLAKFEGGAGARPKRSLDLTAIGVTVGTLAYMSPEQARGEVLDSRSDLFSLGVVLYETATRHIPFPGATSALVFVQLLNQQPESVRNWNEAIPRELDRIIFKLIAKERTQRFQTAQELEEALAKVGEKGGGGWLRKTTATVPLVRAPDPVGRPKRTNPRLSEPQIEAAPPIPPAPSPTVPPPVREAQLLRPVARIPSPDAGPRLQVESPPPELARAPSTGQAGGKPRRIRSGWAEFDAAVDTPVGEPEQKVANGEFAAGIEEPYSRRSEREASKIKRPLFTPLRIAIVIAVLLLLGALVAYLMQRGQLRGAILSDQDPVVLTEIQNRTDNKTLDGSVAEALQIALAESPYLRLRSASSYLAARHQIAPDGGDGGQALAHGAAERLQTKAYLFGTITGTTPPYLIHVDLLNTDSNEVITSVEDPIPSIQQVPSAIDHLAGALRSNVGEGSESITRTSNPLSREATTDLEALHALSQGDVANFSGKTLEALRFYQQAAKLEPKFIQAQLRLAVLYRKERAELAAEDASRLALAAADNASDRTRTIAQFEYEMNVSGDYVRAAGIIRQLVDQNAHDADALEKLARTLRLQGREAEALQTAQQAYAEDPFNLDAYTQAENALIGLDRYEAAAQVDEQAQRIGLGHNGGALITAYLEGREDVLAAAVAAVSTQSENLRADWTYGIYLDNIGQLAEGAALWRSRASFALQAPGLESAAGLMLSQGAFDRALLGDCANGLAMAHEADSHPQGITGLFDGGMADALCGNKSRAQQIVARLQQNYPKSFAATGFYVADIQAGMALYDQDPVTALDLLKSARQYDLISVTPLLRGRAHVALREMQVGIVDFQTVLSHRGEPFIVGSVTYPAAQIGVARAFADAGDLVNSADAYAQFLALWKTANPQQPLLEEARAHGR